MAKKMLITFISILILSIVLGFFGTKIYNKILIGPTKEDFIKSHQQNVVKLQENVNLYYKKTGKSTFVYGKFYDEDFKKAVKIKERYLINPWKDEGIEQSSFEYRAAINKDGALEVRLTEKVSIDENGKYLFGYKYVNLYGEIVVS